MAIGRPGETLPPLGAAREYLAGEAWRGRARDLVDQAQLIVIVLGASEGLAFEYEEIAGRQAIDRVLLVIPPHNLEQLQASWKRFVDYALRGVPIPPPDLETTIVALFSHERGPTYLTGTKRRSQQAASYSLAVQLALRRLSFC